MKNKIIYLLILMVFFIELPLVSCSNNDSNPTGSGSNLPSKVYVGMGEADNGYFQDKIDAFVNAMNNLDIEELKKMVTGRMLEDIESNPAKFKDSLAEGIKNDGKMLFLDRSKSLIWKKLSDKDVYVAAMISFSKIYENNDKTKRLYMIHFLKVNENDWKIVAYFED